MLKICCWARSCSPGPRQASLFSANRRKFSPIPQQSGLHDFAACFVACGALPSDSSVVIGAHEMNQREPNWLVERQMPFLAFSCPFLYHCFLGHSHKGWLTTGFYFLLVSNTYRANSTSYCSQLKQT